MGWGNVQVSEYMNLASQADVRRIALSLPGTIEAKNDFAFGVMVKGKLKGYTWVWKERVTPKKPRVPNPAVLAPWETAKPLSPPSRRSSLPSPITRDFPPCWYGSPL